MLGGEIGTLSRGKTTTTEYIEAFASLEIGDDDGTTCSCYSDS